MNLGSNAEEFSPKVAMPGGGVSAKVAIFSDDGYSITAWLAGHSGWANRLLFHFPSAWVRR